MNDKELKELNIFKTRSIRKQEKIEKALELLDDLVKFTNNLKENRTAYGYPQHLLKEIKKILEK